MANVLLGVTGSVAAIYTPELSADLKKAGHAIKVVATAAALYFFDPAALDATVGSRNRDVLILDEDEWPGRAAGQHYAGQLYQRGDQVPHIELRRWADLLLLAPLDANTLGKLAMGLADNCLTCVWRAWDRTRPVVLAPAMNTLMWNHPATRRHFRLLAEDAGCPAPAEMPLDDVLDWMNRRCPLLRVVPPISKRLACDDVGVGALAGRAEILEVVGAALEGKSGFPA